jgi:hypothetical protein
MERSFEYWHYPRPIRQFFADRSQSAKTMTKAAHRFRDQHVASGRPPRTADWIAKHSGLPWLPLDVKVPAKAMLEEARRLRSHFVAHRGEEGRPEYLGKGWRALTLHGLSATHSRDAHNYSQQPRGKQRKVPAGVTDPYARAEAEAPYHWTEASRRCPVTTAWLKKTLPHGVYFRVRFMVLEPGAFLLPHIDRHYPELSEMYVSLSQPKGAYLKVKDFGYVPQITGQMTMLDVGKVHSVINASDEDRYNLVIIGVHGYSKRWRAMLEDSYTKFMSGRIQ